MCHICTNRSLQTAYNRAWCKQTTQCIYNNTIWKLLRIAVQDQIRLTLDAALCTHCAANQSLSLCKPTLPVPCYSYSVPTCLPDSGAQFSQSRQLMLNDTWLNGIYTHTSTHTLTDTHPHTIQGQTHIYKQYHKYLINHRVTTQEQTLYKLAASIQINLL